MPRKSDITNEEVEKLAILVEKERCLYIVTDPDYHDKFKTFNTWERIAAEMGNAQMNGEDWRKKWRNLRDTYVKKRRESRAVKSGQGAMSRKIRWPYMEIFSFLDKHVYENISQSNIQLDENSEMAFESELQTSEVASDCENLSGDELDRSVSTPIPPSRDATCDEALSTPLPTPSKSRKRGKRDDPFNKSMADLVSCYRQRTEQSETAEDAFFNSCRLRIKKLPAHIQSAVQLQISQIFYNAENPAFEPQQIIPLPRIIRNPQTQHTFEIDSNLIRIIPDQDPLPENVISTAMSIANIN